jgi:hypothetical protein
MDCATGGLVPSFSSPLDSDSLEGKLRPHVNGIWGSSYDGKGAEVQSWPLTSVTFPYSFKN